MTSKRLFKEREEKNKKILWNNTESSEEKNHAKAACKRPTKSEVNDKRAGDERHAEWTTDTHTHTQARTQCDRM